MLNKTKLLIVFLTFGFLNLIVSQEKNECIWKTQLSVILAVDSREEGVILTDELNPDFLKNRCDEEAIGKDRSEYIELVITNENQEEVTLYVTRPIYNLIYRKVDFRKNPNIFSSYQKNNTTYNDQSYPAIPANAEVKYIRKYHMQSVNNQAKLPVIEQTERQSIQIFRVSQADSSSCDLRSKVTDLGGKIQEIEIFNASIPSNKNNSTKNV